MKNPRILSGHPDVPQIAFTFDDGPTQWPIEDMLDALEVGGGIGTFFHTGEWIDRFPEQARAIVERGHELVPHTYHHRKLGQVSREVFFEELKLVELAYQEATGLACPAIMRFPSSDHRPENLDWLAEWNYHEVSGISASDWSGVSSQHLVEKMTPHVGNGAIFVFHSNNTATGTTGSLRPLLRECHKKGIKSVSTSEILKSVDIHIKYRYWHLHVEVSEGIATYEKNWSPMKDEDQFRQLAAETYEWEYRYYPKGFDAERKCLDRLLAPLEKNGIVEDRQLFEGQFKAGTYWAFARAAVNGNDFILMDYGVKEPDSDMFIQIMRWAVNKAMSLGCTRIITDQYLRRMELMCRQLGLSSKLVTSEK